MIARCVYLEGSIGAENRVAFETFLIGEIVPLMKRFPGVLSVRVMSAMEIEDDGREISISFESLYASREAMNFAFTQPIRGQLKKKLGEILPLFNGTMFHITQNVLVDDTI